jgi:hypothetical protein
MMVHAMRTICALALNRVHLAMMEMIALQVTLSSLTARVRERLPIRMVMVFATQLTYAQAQKSVAYAMTTMNAPRAM